MQGKWLFCAFMGVAVAAYGKAPKPYQSGKLLQMNSVHCGTDEKSDRSVLGDIVGTDNANRKSQEVLCQEYVLETDTVTYRIRPKDEKHPELLPIGSPADFRINKDKLLLRVQGGDKERPYIVVSMTPRADSNPAAAPPPNRSQASNPPPAQ